MVLHIHTYRVFQKGIYNFDHSYKIIPKKYRDRFSIFINENTSKSYSRSLLVLNDAARSASGSCVEDDCVTGLKRHNRCVLWFQETKLVRTVERYFRTRYANE